MRRIYIFLFMALLVSSCSFGIFPGFNNRNMNRLELGISKDEVIRQLGRNFTIAEKRMEGGKLIEVLSYRNYPHESELYKFIFINGRLEEWYQELVPVYRVEENE